MLVTIARAGLSTISTTVDAIDKGEWERAYKHQYPERRWDGREGHIPGLNYQAIYQRMKTLEHDWRLVRDGTSEGGVGQRGSVLWRLPTREEIEAKREKRREAMTPPTELVERAEGNARAMGMGVVFVTEDQGRYYARGVVVKTARGEVDTWLSTKEEWESAVERVGLA